MSRGQQMVLVMVRCGLLRGRTRSGSARNLSTTPHSLNFKYFVMLKELRHTAQFAVLVAYSDDGRSAGRNAQRWSAAAAAVVLATGVYPLEPLLFCMKCKAARELTHTNQFPLQLFDQYVALTIKSSLVLKHRKASGLAVLALPALFATILYLAVSRE